MDNTIINKYSGKFGSKLYVECLELENKFKNNNEFYYIFQENFFDEISGELYDKFDFKIKQQIVNENNI